MVETGVRQSEWLLLVYNYYSRLYFENLLELLVKLRIIFFAKM